MRELSVSAVRLWGSIGSPAPNDHVLIWPDTPGLTELIAAGILTPIQDKDRLWLCKVKRYLRPLNHVGKEAANG